MRESAEKIVLSVEQESVSLLLETLTETLQESLNPQARHSPLRHVPDSGLTAPSVLCLCILHVQARVACAQLIAVFCEQTQCSFESHLNMLFLGTYPNMLFVECGFKLALESL